MKIAIEREAADQYVAVADLAEAGILSDRLLRIPIQQEKSGFSAELCGFRAESPAVDSMPPIIEGLIDDLVNYSRLPNYAFVARRSRRVYPVYTIDNEVMATTPGGPVFRHVELAKVRQYLTDYLHDTQILGKDGKSDKLHVRGINATTLGLRRPHFYLKKIVQDEQDFWAPVFENGAGNGFYTYAADKRRDTHKANGLGVLRMRTLVAELLVTQNRLRDRLDLRADRLLPSVWQSLEAVLEKAGQITVAGRELPVYSDGYEVFAMEQRATEERYGLYVGQSTDDLRERVARDFARRGIG